MKRKMAEYEVASVSVQIDVESHVDGLHLREDHRQVQEFSKSKEKETQNREQHMLHIDKAGPVLHDQHVLKFNLTVVDLIEIFN